jgi:hypothetical protein
MPTHFFHCTDGYDLVLDHAGRSVSAKADLCRRARAAAERLMDRLPDHDWSGWVVSVQDGNGRMAAVIPFLELREPARPAPRRASERTAQAHGVSLGL